MKEAIIVAMSARSRLLPAIGPFFAVSVGHLTIDIFNSMGPVLVAFLREPLALSSARVGLAVGSYQLLAGLTQPPFGWLADRVGSRWLGPLSVAWTVGFVSLALSVAVRTGSFWLFLLIFSVAALGSGAFHPQGTMHAARATAGRAATTTAIFFLCGQVGLAGGPALSGLLLDRVGAPGIYALALLTLPSILLMKFGLRESGSAPLASEPSPRGARSHNSSGVVVAVLFVILTCRGWVLIGTAAFLPVIFENAGWTATSYGALTGFFWLGAGISGVMAGRLSDAIGRRPVLSLSTLAGGLLLLWLPVSSGGMAFVVALATGALLGAGHSILIVMAQALLPVRQGLASGLALGYLFGSGAIASMIIGVLADVWTLPRVIQGGAALGMLAAVLTLLLPASGRSRPLRTASTGPLPTESL